MFIALIDFHINPDTQVIVIDCLKEAFVVARDCLSTKWDNLKRLSLYAKVMGQVAIITRFDDSACFVIYQRKNQNYQSENLPRSQLNRLVYLTP